MDFYPHPSPEWPKSGLDDYAYNVLCMRSHCSGGRKMAAIRHLKEVGPGNVKRTVALPVRKPSAAFGPASI
jgi:hypothetical protein